MDGQCSDCWRREHLTFAQLLDPYLIPALRHLCPEHWVARHLTEEALCSISPR